MPYTPQVWQDNVTPADAAHMNYIEAGVAAAVPMDAVTLAGTRIVASKLVASDAQPALRILGDGKHEWGPGGAGAIDTNLYRAANGILKTDYTFNATKGFNAAGMATTATTAYAAGVTGDTNSRYAVGADGKINWGPGNAAVDTNFYRSAVGTLKTDNSFVIGASGQVQSNLTIDLGNTGSKLYFGSALDTSVYRQSAGVLNVSPIYFDASSTNVPIRTNQIAANAAFQNRLLAADVQPAFAIQGDGKHYWGPGGSTALDTTLYRSGANQLTTDGTFQAAGGVSEMSSNNIRILNTAKTQNRVLIHRDFTGADQPTIALYDSAGAERMRYGVAVGTGSTSGFSWGAGGSLDTNLYRGGVNLLRTDGTIQAAGSLYSFWNDAARQIILGQDGSSRATIYFGTALDVGIFREAAGRLCLANTTPGTSTGQTTAPLSVRNSYNGLEFGHTNGAGYGCVLGCENGSGTPNIIFCGENDTGSTYRTRGLKAVIIGNDTAGNFFVNSVANANAAGQAKAYSPVLASAFTVSSDRAEKSEIVDVGDRRASWHDKLMQAKVYEFVRPALDGRHVGVMTDELPADVIQENGLGFVGVDLYKLCTALLGSVQLLNDRIAVLEAR